MGAIVNAENSIGYKPQAWQNLTASRAFGVYYVNTTGRPILVSITADQSGTGSAYLSADNSVLQLGISTQVAASTAFRIGLVFLVPPGESYRVTCPTGAYAVLADWKELR